MRGKEVLAWPGVIIGMHRARIMHDTTAIATMRGITDMGSIGGTLRTIITSSTIMSIASIQRIIISTRYARMYTRNDIALPSIIHTIFSIISTRRLKRMSTIKDIFSTPRIARRKSGCITPPSGRYASITCDIPTISIRRGCLC